MKVRFFSRCIFVLLGLWFLFSITGLSIGNIVFASSDFDLVTFIWFMLYAFIVVLFFLKEKIAKNVMIAFTFLWIAMQSLNWIPPKSANGVAQYNKIFEGKHYILSPSDRIIIPDTYHLILFCLVFIAFICSIFFVVISRKKSKL